MILNSYNIHFL